MGSRDDIPHIPKALSYCNRYWAQEERRSRIPTVRATEAWKTSATICRMPIYKLSKDDFFLSLYKETDSDYNNEIRFITLDAHEYTLFMSKQPTTPISDIENNALHPHTIINSNLKPQHQQA
jgi:hypothetical protein